MKNVTLFTANATNLSLSNICHGGGARNDRYASVIDLMDAVEDSKTAKDFLTRISALNFVGFENPKIDRETDEYVRLRAEDGMGNTRYMKALK